MKLTLYVVLLHWSLVFAEEYTKLSHDRFTNLWSIEHPSPVVAVSGQGPEMHYLGLVRVTANMVIGGAESPPENPLLSLIVSLRRSGDAQLWRYSKNAELWIDGIIISGPIYKSMIRPAPAGEGYDEQALIILTSSQVRRIMDAKETVLKIGRDELPLPPASLEPVRRVVQRFRKELASGTFNQKAPIRE